MCVYVCIYLYFPCLFPNIQQPSGEEGLRNYKAGRDRKEGREENVCMYVCVCTIKERYKLIDFLVSSQRSPKKSNQTEAKKARS